MIEQISVTQLPQWLAARAAEAEGTPQVLDVRETDELQIAAIDADTIRAAGGELLHIPMSELGGRFGELDPTQPLACLCHHGGRSQRVALFLAQQGFERLGNVQGGIDAWSREVDPAVPRY